MGKLLFSILYIQFCQLLKFITNNSLKDHNLHCMKRCKTGWLLVNQIRSQLLNSTAQQLMIIISVVFLWVIANLLRTKSSQNDRSELKSSPPLTIRVMHKIYIKMPNYLWLLSQPQYRALLSPFRGATQITCRRCFNADCNIMQQPAKERSQTANIFGCWFGTENSSSGCTEWCILGDMRARTQRHK